MKTVSTTLTLAILTAAIVTTVGLLMAGLSSTQSTLMLCAGLMPLMFTTKLIRNFAIISTMISVAVVAALVIGYHPSPSIVTSPNTISSYYLAKGVYARILIDKVVEPLFYLVLLKSGISYVIEASIESKID